MGAMQSGKSGPWSNDNGKTELNGQQTKLTLHNNESHHEKTVGEVVYARMTKDNYSGFGEVDQGVLDDWAGAYKFSNHTRFEDSSDFTKLDLKTFKDVMFGGSSGFGRSINHSISQEMHTSYKMKVPFNTGLITHGLWLVPSDTVWTSDFTKWVLNYFPFKTGTESAKWKALGHDDRWDAISLISKEKGKTFSDGDPIKIPYYYREGSVTKANDHATTFRSMGNGETYWINVEDGKFLYNKGYSHTGRIYNRLGPLGIHNEEIHGLALRTQYIIFPAAIAGYRNGAYLAESLATGFIKYIGANYFVPGSKGGEISVDTTFGKMNENDKILLYLLGGDPTITGVHPDVSDGRTNYFTRMHRSTTGSPPQIKKALILLDNDVENLIYNVNNWRKLIEKCKSAFTSKADKFPIQSSAGGVSSTLSFLNGKDLSLKKFAELCTWENTQLDKYHPDGRPCSMEGWLKKNYKSDPHRTATGCWGGIKNPDKEVYNLWGSTAQAGLIKPIRDHTKEVQIQPLGDNQEVRRGGKDRNIAEGRDWPLYLDQKYCQKDPKGRELNQWYRAFGKFTKGDLAGKTNSESGDIETKYQKAFEAMGIPIIFPSGWPAEPWDASFSDPSYPEEPGALAKAAAWVFTPGKSNFTSARILQNTIGSQLQTKQVAGFSPENIKYTLNQNSYVSISLKKPDSILNWHEGNYSTEKIKKAEQKSMADGEANKQLSADLSGVNVEVIPEFKGIYQQLLLCKNIVSNVYSALKKRMEKTEKWGQCGLTKDESKNAAGDIAADMGTMVATYASVASQACAQWYTWVKANNAIVFKWYALRFKIEADPDIGEDDLAKWAKSEGKKIEGLSIQDMKNEQDWRGKLLAMQKKRLKSDLDAANERSGQADDAKRKQRDREKFADQCILLGNMKILRDKYRKLMESQVKEKSSVHKNGPYNNRFIMLDHTKKEHTKIPNLLSSPKKQDIKLFTEITPDLVSALTPKIRLYKVFSNNKIAAGALTEIEFPFENITNFDSKKYMTSDIDRGHGVGIKSFSFSFDGTTPATARKDIKAELVLYFQNFQDLTRKRNFGKGYPNFRYIELLLMPFNERPRSHPNDYKPDNYRIRADVGWTPRTDAAFKQILEKRCQKDPIFKDIENPLQQFNDALDKTNKSFYLNMIDHDLDIKNDGTVEIKITYAAYVESVMKSSELDALSTPESLYLKELRRAKLDTILEKEDCAPHQLSDLKAVYKKQDDRHLKASYQSLKRRLIQRMKVFYLNIENTEINMFVEQGNMPPIKPEKVQIVPNLEYSATNLKNMDTENETKINFFFLGDLIYTALDCMYHPAVIPEVDHDFYQADVNVGSIRRSVAKTKILLSSFVYDDYTNGEKKKAAHFNDVNIAEIPISMSYFQKWMTENVIEPERKKYPVLDFIRDISQMVVSLLLETCINQSVDKSISFETGQILSLEQKTKHKSDMLELLDSQSNKLRVMVDLHYKKTKGIRLPLPTASENASIEDFYNYLFLYPVSSMNTSNHTGAGSRKEDEEQGVYHYQIGSNRGLLKTIKFSKVDMQYIREARFFNHGHDGLMQLAAVYKASLEMIGNTIYYPGMELFIDPRGMGGTEFDPTAGRDGDVEASIANALGIGGYHIVTKVKSTITPDKFTTTVDAQFHYSGDGQASLLASSGRPNKGAVDSIRKAAAKKVGGKKTCSAALHDEQVSYTNAMKSADKTDTSDKKDTPDTAAPKTDGKSSDAKKKSKDKKKKS